MPNDGNEAEGDGAARHKEKVGDTAGNRVCGDGGRAEPRKEPLHDEFADVEQTVFNAARNADTQNAADHGPFKMYLLQIGYIDHVVVVADQTQNDDR